MILPTKTIQIKQLNPKLWDPFFFNYRLLKESSNSWLEMVPTIEGGNPAERREARGESRGALAPRPLVMDELNLDCCIVLLSLVFVDCLSD